MLTVPILSLSLPPPLGTHTLIHLFEVKVDLYALTLMKQQFFSLHFVRLLARRKIADAASLYSCLSKTQTSSIKVLRTTPTDLSSIAILFLILRSGVTTDAKKSFY